MQPRMNGNGQARGQTGRPNIPAKELRGEDLIRHLMDERRPEIEAMFARDADAAASYTRAVGLAVNAYKKLQAESDRPIDEYSTVQAALWAFQRKLDPGTEVYFVPYAGKVTPIVAPQGLINLAFRSGMVLDVQARWVFRKEVEDGNFEHMLGSEEWVKHRKGTNARPIDKNAAWRELAFAYAVINLKGGGRIIEVHDRGDIEYYKSLSKAKGGLWFDWPAEAARKAVLKQALGRAPKQSEVSEILAADAANEASLEIPEDVMQRVMARVGSEMVGDPKVPGAPTERKSDPGASANGNGAGNGQPARETPKFHAKPGDAKAIIMPKAKDAPAVSILDADEKSLSYWEARGRKAFDAGEIVGDYAQRNITQLATIRMVMRQRNMDVVPHPFFDGGLPPADRGDGALSPEEEAAMLPPADGYAHAE